MELMKSGFGGNASVTNERGNVIGDGEHEG
jgi:hypothetical protein